VLKLAAEGEIKVADAVSRIADSLDLSPDDRAELLPSRKQTVLSNRVHWAKTYMAKAGLVAAPRRGFFAITDRGRQVLSSRIGHIDNKFLLQYPEFVAFRERSNAELSDEVLVQETVTPEQGVDKATPDELIRLGQKQLEATLSGDLLDKVRGSSPAFFEQVVVDLLIAMRYGGTAEGPGRTVGGSGDGGVDCVIDQDPLGLDRVYVQAKRYAADNQVGAGAIRDFFGSLNLHKASKGLFVTASGFTNSARETVEKLGSRIVLIDGEALARLMIRHNVGCRIDVTIQIKKIDEDYFE
jgi:restriction system protein